MNPLIWSLAMVGLVAGALLGSIPMMVFIERRGAAFIQRRSGPNRVGPWGLLQALTDAIKLIFKEENIPLKSHKFLFIAAPFLAVFPPFFAFIVIPFGGSVFIDNQEFLLQVTSFDASLLFLLAISSLHVYCVLTAGWASNNKYSLMGALRAASQMISYEIAIGLCIVSLAITYGTLDLREIVEMQGASSDFPTWGIVTQPLAFFIMWICSFAETNRLPFDLPEGETELVAGYHTEYSGLKFALFFLGEYAAMLLISAFMVTLFLGGYHIPFISELSVREFFLGFDLSLTLSSVLTSLIHVGCFVLKVLFFMWVFIWVRWTLPRFRYDQLMDLGWKVLLPLGVLNIVLSFVISFFWGA